MQVVLGMQRKEKIVLEFSRQIPYDKKTGFWRFRGDIREWLTVREALYSLEWAPSLGWVVTFQDTNTALLFKLTWC